MVMLKGKEYTGAGLGTNFGHKKPTASGADGQTRDQWESMWVDGLAELGDRAAAAVEAGESAATSQHVVTEARTDIAGRHTDIIAKHGQVTDMTAVVVAAGEDVIERHADVESMHVQIIDMTAVVVAAEGDIEGHHADIITKHADITAAAEQVATDRPVVVAAAEAAQQDRHQAEQAAQQAQGYAAGLNMPAVSSGDAGKSLIVNGDGSGFEVGSAASTVQQAGPLFAPSAAGFILSGKSLLAAYEQVANSLFAFDFNYRSSYAEQDLVNGTDAVGGAFQLHNTAGAVIDADTKLLIHADGVNGSTEIIDGRGITPFGTHCAYFDGTAYWTVPTSSKIAFGSGDFTFETWVRPEQAPTSGSSYFWDCRAGGNNFVLVYEHATSKFRFDIGNGAASVTASSTSAAKLWHHVAVQRQGTTITLYVNGINLGTVTSNYALTTTSMVFGRHQAGTSGYEFIGWLDQFRVSKVARYTGNFTPPTAEFTADADTVHLFQFNDGHGSQFIRDSSKSGHEVRINSSGSIVNTRAKFGSTSLSGSIRIADTRSHQDLLPSSDDFTADFWVYPTAWPGSQATLFGMYDVSSYGPQISITTSGGLTWSVSSNGTSYNLANGVTAGALTLNQWNHVALVRSGATLYLFVGGVQTATLTVGTSAIFFGGGTVILNRGIGADTPSISGQFDELRIKRWQAVWTSNFTPPTAPYTTDANTILLCHFEGANGDTVTLDSSESSYAASAAVGSVPVLGMIGGAGLNSTYTRGGHGTSMFLNGTTSYASIAYATPSAGHPIYFSASDKLCIEGWFYVSSFAGSPRLFNLAGVGNISTSQLDFFITTAGVPTFGTAVTAWATGPTVTTGWVHVAAVREGRGWVVYSNGVAGTPAVPQNNPSYANEAYNLFLGCFGGASTASNYLPGAIDSFRITHGKPRYTANFTPGNLTQDEDTALLWVFDGAVGQKWVKELSKNTAMIPSTNARTVKDGRYITPTLTGAAHVIQTTTKKFGTGALSFQQVDGNYYSLPHSPDFAPQGDYTFDFWVMPVGNQGRYIFSKNQSTTTTSAYMFFFENSTNKAVFQHVSGTTTTEVKGTSSFSTSTLTHVAITLSGTTLRLFVAGTLEATATVAGPMNVATTSPLVFGNSYNGIGSASSCILDEFRISSVARWTANFTPPTMAYGQQYVTGPFWVATKPGASALDLSAFSSIDSAALTGSTPPGTSLKFLLSIDGYATPLRRWTGTAWAATAHSMMWSAGAGTLTTVATSSQLADAANSWVELQAGLLALDLTTASSLNVVAILSTSNPQVTPALDAITLSMDEYQLMQPGVDYTVKRKRALGVQALEFKRLRAGAANHVVDYVG